MKRFTIFLAILLAWSQSGCHGTRPRSTDPSRQISTDSYAQANTTPPQVRLSEPDRKDLIVEQNAPNTQPLTMATLPGGEVQPVRSVQTDRLQTSRTVPVAEKGSQNISLIYPSPEYGIIKLDKLIPQEVEVNTPFKYSIIMTNLTRTTLANLVLTETIDTAFQLKEATPVPQQTRNQLIWRIDTLGSKVSKRIEIMGISATPVKLKGATTITYDMAASSDIRVVQPILELTRKAQTEVLLGDLIGNENTVKNTGTGSAHDVQIVEPLPAGITTEEGKNEVRFDAGILQTGQSQSFVAKLKANRIVPFVGKAVAFSKSIAMAQSTPSTVMIRRPVLTITRSGPERVFLGHTVTYDLSVVNKGDGPAHNTLLEDCLPPGMTDIQAVPEGSVSGGKLTWDLGTLEPNVVKVVRVSYKPTAPGILNCTTTVNAHSAVSASSTVHTAILGKSDIRLDVIDQKDPIQVQEAVTYLITVINKGSASDYNLQVICDLEDNLQYLSSTGPTQATLIGRSLHFRSLSKLAPDEKVNWQVITKAIRPGTVRFKVTLASEDLSRPIEKTETTFLYE